MMKSLFSSRKIDIERALVEPPKMPFFVQKLTKPHTPRFGKRKNVWVVCTLSANDVELREAIIIDVSKTGARLRFRMRGSLPQTVRIKAPRIGLNRLASVVWQDTFNAGLKFIPSGLG